MPQGPIPSVPLLPPVTVTTEVGATNNVSLPSSTTVRQLMFAYATYVASATVGNRIISLGLVNSSGTVVAEWQTSANATASATYVVEFMPGTYRETAFDASDTIQTPFPIGLVIPAGYSLKVYDKAGISTADTVTATFQTSV